MNIDRAKELIQVQLQFSSGYNRNAVRMILGEVQRNYGQQEVDTLIREFRLDESFGLKVGTNFSTVGT
ncbi:MAG: hypothetical protein OQK42_04005 [Sedimenticola sp.]|uniref:Uncharacterized protein n=1 Tax=Sedimenticola thiotaurini TaxID=1543721 RepID=A0A558CJB5_9GAMM|nr:hypothetical protein [Sedimenticola sp.]TVT48861.1 MAG: hypothetical protein FHK82_17535 [Sedimenticola thiotaurini]MCW8921954.1 hypothetical protein [Sedimenticola sp.]MCW8945915.1 hypothetical protein [Sedimenticola sp.]MCW8949782.1 hypothetical protein [Sedimenticola sp.]